jgi:hypothetical protein
MMRDSTLLLIAGGVIVAGLALRHQLDTAAAAAAAAPGRGLNPRPVFGPAPAAGPTITPPTPPLTVNSPAAAPPAAATPPPAATPAPATPAASNAAYEAQEAAARALQAQDFADQVAALKARVASGEVSPGSPYYESTLAYLANMRGGVATAAAERELLRAAGLAGRPRIFH